MSVHGRIYFLVTNFEELEHQPVLKEFYLITPIGMKVVIGRTISSRSSLKEKHR